MIAIVAHLTRARCLLVSMLFVSLALIAILYKPATTFNTTNPRPVISAYMPKERAAGAEAAIPVHVGMYIMNFPIFDILTNNFVADIMLWFEFDPSLLPLETVQKFSFDRGTIISKSEPDMKIIKDKLFVQYQVRLQFTSPLDHKLFPLNDHRLYIVLENTYVTPEELFFTSSRTSFLIAPGASTADWNIIDQSAQPGYISAELDSSDPHKVKRFPAVVFSLDLQKQGIRKIFIIMLPMLLLFFISLFVLSLNPAVHARSILTLTTGTLTGLIAYRFVIEKIVPDVGYFTLADNFFNLFLAVIFILFLMGLYAVNLGKNTAPLLLFKGLVLIAVQLVLVVCFYFLVHQ